MKELKIRLPEELKQKLADRAARNDRSTAAEVLNIIKAAVRADCGAGAISCTGSGGGDADVAIRGNEPT